MIPFGAYEPDTPKVSSGVSTRIINALPVKGQDTNDWSPFPGPAAVTGAAALPDVARGQRTVINPSLGTYETYVGTQTKIYLLSSTFGWTEIGSGYNIPDGDYWSIEPFGDYVLFTNTLDGQLAYNMRTPAGVNPIAGAPKARSLASIFDTMMAFSCDGDTLLSQNSSINDAFTYTPNTNGASYQPYADGEELIGGVELTGSVGVVFQRDQYHVLTRDPQLLYTKQRMAFGVGSVGHQSIVRAGGRAFCLSQNGFFATDGGPPAMIGDERVNRTFFRSADISALAQVQGAYWSEKHAVVWRYKTTTDGNDGIVSGLIGYNIELDRWFVGEVDTVGIFAFASPLITLDDITDPLDSIPRSLDSRFYLGGLPSFACIGSDGTVQTFDGDSLPATLETQVSATPQTQLVRSCIPSVIGDRSAFTVQVGTSDFQGDTEDWSDPQAIQPSGRAMLRKRGKNIKFRVNAVAGGAWTSARGIDTIDVATGGPR